MCIRDRCKGQALVTPHTQTVEYPTKIVLPENCLKIVKMGKFSYDNTKFDVSIFNEYLDCLLYTSDAADERSSVDLGGRRIIKKKTNKKKEERKNNTTNILNEQRAQTIKQITIRRQTNKEKPSRERHH